MAQRKLSLGDTATRPTAAATDSVAPSTLELFLNSGVIYHEIKFSGPLPDLVCGFMVMEAGEREGFSVRRAEGHEDPDVEVSAVEHLAELQGRWLPCPYQLSAPHCTQLYVAAQGTQPRLMLAIDTLANSGAGMSHLDPKLDVGRPFRALEPGESGAFLDHPETRDFLRKLEAEGVERAPFKLAALLEAVAPLLPRIRFASRDERPTVDVSLVLDLGNSRSTAVLVEPRDNGIFSIPLQIRGSSDPFNVSEEPFASRITFLPSKFDKTIHNVAVADSFQLPSIATLGREALDRAMETPHRYACSLSGPKRYLWESRPNDETWHFAVKRDATTGEHAPISGKLLKYVEDSGGGLTLREDGPSMPPAPRYPPRTLMLFALVEILSHAYSQINSPEYRAFQGKQSNPRRLARVALTFPSAMRPEERAVYELLIQNAVVLTSFFLNVPGPDRPNWNPSGHFDPFLIVDEAQAAQMVYVYEEASQVFGGSLEELVSVYGRNGSVRIGSIDIGGGTTDVMIAEYADNLPGTGTAVTVKRLFKDGVSIAGDDVCRAIVEDIIFEQILHQLPSAAARARFAHLFRDGDSGLGAAWRTLRAKLVPYLWLPLARCYWSVGEGFTPADHSPERAYSLAEIFDVFPGAGSAAGALREADDFLCEQVDGFPGLNNLFLTFDASDVNAAVDRALREPLRRYSDILAQFQVDLLVLAGRASALTRIRELLVEEMPVSPPRIKSMAEYPVGDWYPSKWRNDGVISDPKTTVTAGAMVLMLAGRNHIPGFMLDSAEGADEQPIFGLYQDTEPHISHANELFKEGEQSAPIVFTKGMLIGFRNVASEEMDGNPLFEIRPANAAVERALVSERVDLSFKRDAEGLISISKVEPQSRARSEFDWTPECFELALKTVTVDRYWLDTGVFRFPSRYFDTQKDTDGANE